MDFRKVSPDFISYTFLYENANSIKTVLCFFFLNSLSMQNIFYFWQPNQSLER